MYHRTAAQKGGDFAAAAEFEQEVRAHLPEWIVDNTAASDRLDFWLPGVYVEVKAKRQPLTARWHLVDGVDERDLFVLDELSVRRALRCWPEAYFLLSDEPTGRLFLASITDLCVADKVRRQRVGKGKWLMSLLQFHQLDSLDEIVPVAMADLASTPWKRSECLGLLPVPQI